MMQSIGLGYQNVVTKNETRFNDKVFANAQKDVKKQEVRDADWGLSAAQTCLARDLVTASPEEAGLIMEKMNFIQAQMNGNLQVDSDISSKKASSKCDVITARGEAIEKDVTAVAQGAKEICDGVSTVTSSVPEKIIDSVLDKTVGTNLDLVA